MVNDTVWDEVSSMIVNTSRSAACYFDPNANGGIGGTVYFEEDLSSRAVNVKVKLSGVPAGEHGFHIHEYGDVSNGCDSAGAHFNPHDATHGDVSVGHVGDLGNVVAGTDGIVDMVIKAPRLKIRGIHSVVGRALVLHANPDDLGSGDDQESKLTGNSGPRIACGVIIHIAEEKNT